LKMSKNHWDCSGKTNPASVSIFYDNKTFDTINDFAKYLSVHRRTASKMIKDGKAIRLEK